MGAKDDERPLEVRARLVDREKELHALQRLASVLTEETDLREAFRRTVEIIPAAMQSPGWARARLVFGDERLASDGFHSGAEVLRVASVEGGRELSIEVAYVEPEARGPLAFLPEERAFLESMLNLLRVAVARQRAFETLDERNEKMRLAFRAARMGVWDLDLRTRATQWSPELSELLGLDPVPEATLWTHLDRIHPEDREPVQRAVAAACAGEPARDFEFRMSGANGTWHVMSASTLLVVGPDGAPVRLVAALRDVTRWKLLEAAIQQATKVEAVGLVATNLTHDFNNLLTVIMSGAASLLGELTNPAQREVLGDMLAATECAAGLTRQLLAFSRRIEATPSWTDIWAIVGRLRPLLQSLVGKGIVLSVSGGPLPEVWLEPSQFEQILLNLVVNARDALGERGRIEVRTSLRDGDGEPSAPSAQVCLEVSDDGPGIPGEVLPRIFEPFFTTKPVGEGTGLGLALVADIVNKAAGRVEVESEPGRGTTFRVLFPARRSA